MSYATEIAADTPLAWYRMQEASGLLQDSSGNARHATGSNGTCTYQQASPISTEPSDYSIAFAGGQWFTVPDVGLDVGDSFTLEYWLKRVGSGYDENPLSKGLAYQLYLDATDILRLYAGGNVRYSNVAITDTNWHHYVGTKDGASAFVYIDGNDVSTYDSDPTAADTSDLLNIGRSSFGGSEVIGNIDELAIYDTALSQTRIQAHYNAAFTTPGRSYKRLVGPAQLSGSATTLYTCPASTVARTLGIHASNPSGSPVDINVSIGADAAGTRVYDDFAVSADGVETNFDPYELAAGDVIQGWASTAGTVVLTISGYEDPV